MMSLQQLRSDSLVVEALGLHVIELVKGSMLLIYRIAGNFGKLLIWQNSSQFVSAKFKFGDACFKCLVLNLSNGQVKPSPKFPALR